MIVSVSRSETQPIAPDGHNWAKIDNGISKKVIRCLRVTPMTYMGLNIIWT